MKKFNLVACGGTFDHFHRGHKEFLRFACSLGKKIMIGITSNEYVRNSKFKVQNSPLRQDFAGQAKLIESYAKRKESVERFLDREHIADKVEIAQIHDVYGSTRESALPIDAIVVTEDSKAGAQLINKTRKEKGLPELEVEIAPLIFGEDGKVISSSRIRNGEINREGRPYMKTQWLMAGKLTITEDLRQELKRPVGILYTDTESVYNQLDPGQTITVGDVVTKTSNDKSFGQKFSVVDFYVEREKKFENLSQLGFSANEKVIEVDNPVGTLTAALFRSVANVFHSQEAERIVFLVHGEEDLSALSFMLASPLGFVILYGQPKQGVVKVIVSEETKEHAYNLVCRFLESRI